MDIIIYIIILFILIILLIKISKVPPKLKQKPKTMWDKFMEIPGVKERKELYDAQSRWIDKLESSDQDIIPWGIGEFGYDVTNPIPAHTAYGNIYYLSRLRTMDGEKVKYTRTGSTSVKNILNPIDVYIISDSNGELCTLYLSMYHKKTSERAPKNFYLVY